VVELFEARNPKGVAQVADISGTVALKEDAQEKARNYIVTITANDGNSMEYKIPKNAKLEIVDGQKIEAGDQLTVGSVNPQDILRTKGVHGVQESMIREVQSAYRSNGVHINDKHIEVIVRQMLRKVKITDPRDTSLIVNELVDINRIEEENEKVLEEGGLPAMAARVLLGISKAALATASFLSAASFQETARVLTEAAIKSKTDHLVGLKENIIIGKLIPAGTGLKAYRNINVEKTSALTDARVIDEIPLFDEAEF
jgi:DNA-directed RNA polymerase subunit beta'